MGDGVANLATCGALLILSPALKHWGPLDGKADVANLPTCGPLLILLDKTIRAEPGKCLQTLSFAWSLMVFVAAWAARGARYCAFRAFIDYVQKVCIDKRTYWFSGVSSPGIQAATPSKPHANMLKF